MVTQDEIQKRRDADKIKQDAIDKKQAEIKAQIAASGRGAGNQLRGYNYSSYDKSTGELKGNNPQTGAYQYNPRTGQMSGNIPNDEAQRIESVAVRNQLTSRQIDQQIAELQRQKAASDEAYQNMAKSGRLSGGQIRQGNITGKTIAAQIASLNAEKQSLASKPEQRNVYTGVMTKSGKIYESAAEAARQGQTVLKDRQGRDVTFEGDIRATAGYGQSGRGYNYLDTTDKNIVHGATKGNQFSVEKKTGLSEGNVPTAIAAAFPWTGQESKRVGIQEDYSKNFVTGGYQQSDTGFPVVTNPNVITNRSGKGTPSDPFRANQPEENRLAGFANPVWKVGDKTFQDKKEADLFIASQTIQQGQYWTVPDAQGNPMKNKRGGVLKFKSQESAQKYMERQGIGVQSSYLGFSEGKAIQGPPNVKSESVDVPAGSLTYLYGQQPESKLNVEIGSEFNILAKESKESWKKMQSGKPLDILTGTYGQATTSVGMSLLGTVAFVKNYAEQTYAPFLAEKLGLKYKPKAPISLDSSTPSTVVIPYQFEKGRFDRSWKEYASRQAKYVSEFGPVTYGTGLFFDYGGLKGAPSAIALSVKGITQKGVKALSPSLGKAAKSAAITNAPSSIFKGESKFASPSASWDVAEKITPAGLKKANRPTAILPEGQRNPSKSVPNPFGKEREPIYTIKLRGQEAIKKGKKLVQDIPQAIDVITPLEIIGLGKAVKADARLIAQKTKSGLRSTADAFSEWNRSGRVETIPEGYTRRNITLERMRNMMWPEEPILPPKKSDIPKGYKRYYQEKAEAKEIFKNIKSAGLNFKTEIKNIPSETKKELGKLPVPQIPNVFLRGAVAGSRVTDVIQSKISKAKKSFDVWNYTPEAKLPPYKRIQRESRIAKLKAKGIEIKDFFYNEPVVEPKITVSLISKQGLKNLTREDTKIPSNVKDVKREPKQLSFGVTPTKSPPFVYGAWESANIEKNIIGKKLVKGESPVKTTHFTSQDALRIPRGKGAPSLQPWTPRDVVPSTFTKTNIRYEAKKSNAFVIKFNKGAVPTLGRLSKGVGISGVRGEPALWPDNWQLKQRIKKNDIEYKYVLKDVDGKKQWEEISPIRDQPVQIRTESERLRQMPKEEKPYTVISIKKLDTSQLPKWPENWKDLTRQSIKEEKPTPYLEGTKRGKTNVNLIKRELENTPSDYFKSPIPFRLKTPKVKDWPDNWQSIKESDVDVSDYMTQRRSTRKFSNQEIKNMMRGGGEKGTTDIKTTSISLQTDTPLLFLEKGKLKSTFFMGKKEFYPQPRGMDRLKNVTKEEQERLDKQWGQGIAKVITERKTPNTFDFLQSKKSAPEQPKSRYGFVSIGSHRPVFTKSNQSIFDRKISIRKGKLVRGLKPIRGPYEYLQDKFAETRVIPKQGKPMKYSSMKIEERFESEPFGKNWKSETIRKIKNEPKEGLFTRKRLNKYDVFETEKPDWSKTWKTDIIRKIKGLPVKETEKITPKPKIEVGSIKPYSKKHDFIKTSIELGEGKADTFGRKFEKSPVGSPSRDVIKNRTNVEKLIDKSKEEQRNQDKYWDEQRKKIDEESRRTKSGQILEPPQPKPKDALSQPAPEIKDIDGISAAKPSKKPESSTLIVPPLPKEQKKKPYLQESSYITYEIPLNKNRPQITPRSMSGSTLNIGNRSIISARVNISQITPQKTGIRSDVKSGQKLYTPQKVKSFEITKTSEKLSEALKQPQKQKSRSKTRTPEINKPMAKQTPVFKTKQPAKFVFRTPEILIEPPKMLIPIPPTPINKPKKSSRKSGRKGMDFLGSSPTDSIVGLYSRRGSSDIILGDRASQKQLDKDRRTKSIGLGLGFSNRKKFKI